MAFYFAWADASETTFGPEHEREDENVFSAEITHDEGQFPTLTLEVRNPRVGLLGPGRQVWAWLAWNDGATTTPMFFGRLVGIPDNLFAEVVTLRFVARPFNYAITKQAYAQTLKVAPYYDPLFLSEERRDDADAILEGYSALWHIDRLASDVSISDVLVGEDGTEVFTADDVPYDSVAVSVDQPPLKSVQVIADVSWQQTFSGVVDLGAWSFSSYTGGSIVSGWPKPGASLGDGWTAEAAYADDIYGVENAETTTINYNWQNAEKKHRNGDTMSVTASESKPNFLGPAVTVMTSREIRPGWLDPYAKDEDGDPAPINIPASGSVQYSYVPLWKVYAALTARYDANRDRTERLAVSVSADTQAVVTDDESASSTETISVDGGSVGVPIAAFLRWSTVAGTAVSLGQIVFPDSWTGASAAQLCTTAGTCGMVAPAFSGIVGTTATDGTAVWTSLGNISGLASAPDWKADAYTPQGTVILPREGTTYYVATTTGVSGLSRPSFNATQGATTSDGTAVWTSLGAGEIPIGGTVGYTARNAYFPTDRGLQSLDYLICLARARLRLRSRAVKISFDCAFSRGLSLSCRKNATIYDPRLPGGNATGKIVSYTIAANGDSGELKVSVSIGCAVGNGTSLTLAAGSPSYVDAGYVADGYQYMDGQIAITDDVGYTPPFYTPNADDLLFPLSRASALINAQTHGSAASQGPLIEAALNSQRGSGVEAQNYQTFFATASAATKASKISAAEAVKDYSVWFELELVPVTGGPYESDYYVSTTPLSIPKSIDLSAA